MTVKVVKSIPLEIRVVAGWAVVLLFWHNQQPVPLTVAEEASLFLVGYLSLTLFDLIVAVRSTRVG